MADYTVEWNGTEYVQVPRRKLRVVALDSGVLGSTVRGSSHREITAALSRLPEGQVRRMALAGSRRARHHS